MAVPAEVMRMNRCRSCGKEIADSDCIGGYCPLCEKITGDAAVEIVIANNAWWSR